MACPRLRPAWMRYASCCRCPPSDRDCGAWRARSIRPMSDDLAWKLLVVEDSETQAIKLVGLLEEAGIGAAHAASAKDALDALRDNQFDLVLVDYHLPDMQGDDLCRQIRLSPGTADVLLLMLTGDSQAEVERLRSEEHPSELQSLMRHSYAVCCLKHKTQLRTQNYEEIHAH